MSRVLSRARVGKTACQSRWITALDLDLTALATEDLDHTAGSVVIDGQTWTQAYGTTALDDLDLTLGTGLVPNMSAVNTTFNTDAPTCWTLYRAWSDIVSGFSPDMLVEVAAILGGIGDAASEMAGIVVRTASGTSYGAAAQVGHNGTARCLRTNRQAGATVTYSDVTTGMSAVDAVRLVGKRQSWVSYAGASVGGGFPTSWARGKDLAFDAWAGSSIWTTPSLGVTAQTGNTTNNYAPSFARLRVRYQPGSDL